MSAEQVKILLVEDDAVDRMAFLRYIEKEKLPYPCRCASTVAEAKEILLAEKFDVIVLDHNLTDGLGFELLPHVGSVPVIFVTGSESPDTAVQAMKAGAADYLMKDHDRHYLQLMPLSVERALQQRVAQEQLRESQELFRQSFNEAPIGKAFVRPDGTFIRVNRALSEITGRPEWELPGKGFELIFGEATGPQCMEKFFPMPPGASAVQRMERSFRNPKNEEVFLQLDVALVPDSRGEMPTYVLHVQDISAKRRAEELHARLEKQLHQAQKMEALGALAGGVAHEFNNMLGAIMGYTEMARMELEESHPVRPNLDEVLKASHRAKEIIQQILTFSRRQELKRELIQVQPMVLDAVKLIRPIIPSAVEIKVEIPGNGSPIFGNITQIHQALLNLCTNSWHAMGDHGGQIIIGRESVVLRRDAMPARLHLPEGKYVVITVTDNGQGMDEATLNRIFEPFFTTKGPGRGSGLGMPVVDGIMKAHEGAVIVDSTLGRGTVVHLYFPASAAEAAVRPAQEKRTLPHGRGQHIMLVDDETTLTQLGTMMLQRLGYKATAFNSARDAVEMLRRQPNDFDLIVTDLTMPVISGLELASECQKIKPGIPIILASGYVEETIREEAAYLGIRRILGKPLSTQILAEAVHAVLTAPPTP